MMLATAIQPKISAAAARARLSGGLRRSRHGRLRLVVDFYVPYYLFRVTVRNGGRQSECLRAIDAATAQLDLFAFEEVPAAVPVDHDRFIAARAGAEQALDALCERMKREVYLKGFFRVKDLGVRGTLVGTLHLPYWVGVYERDGLVKLDVLNGLNNRFEGAKVRALIEDWFHGLPAGRGC